jgi:hypothetical protein
MATYQKFQPFIEAAFEKVHNLGSDQLVVALTNSAPSAANSVLTDITQIAYTNCSSRNLTTSSSAQTSGTYKIVIADLTLTATGTVGPFQYIVIYNDTAASDNLICFADYGSAITLQNGDQFNIDFDGTNGLFQST